MSNLTIKLEGANLTEVMTDTELTDTKSLIGGSLFKDGENHELLKVSSDFIGLSKSATSGFYSVAFEKGKELITRYVSRGNMVSQAENAGKVSKTKKGNSIAWKTINWKVVDGELLVIV